MFNVSKNEIDNQINIIKSRLSLRKPQLDSLEILGDILLKIRPSKNTDLNNAIKVIQKDYKISDFERNFVSLCFSLATGVGKTRLMGAFMSLMVTIFKIKNFIIIAPNLTIYEKLLDDFSPSSEKYVFKGLGEFSSVPPRIITGDNFDSGIEVTPSSMFKNEITINIFNIAKLNSEVRGGRSPRIKRLSEYIGLSYFEYLSKLDDLVMLMDESHRYRADAGLKALNDLKPIIGLELTATPQIEKNNKTINFKNVIYNYPLANAINDGFVKIPAVATREDFDPSNYKEEKLEIIKIEDGLRIHEDTKIDLFTFSKNYEQKKIKPFVLIISKDTNHAEKIFKMIESDKFFSGKYKGKSIILHSNQSKEESDENVRKLLSLDKYDNPTEIVIHVDKLKEGWDVRNLYTIIPLRAANSNTLVEQSIGRGLRLPFNKHTGIDAVDRLTIIAHDKFEKIISEANDPNSIIKKIIKIEKEIPQDGKEIKYTPIKIIEDISKEIESLKTINPDQKNEILNDIVKKLKLFEKDVENTRNIDEIDIKAINKEIIETFEKKLNLNAEDTLKFKKIISDFSTKKLISIPKIYLKPKGFSKSGYKDFELDTSSVTQQPVPQNILIEHLNNNKKYTIRINSTLENEIDLEKPEKYIINNLILKDDINYDEFSDSINKHSKSIIDKLRTYLKNKNDILNVVQYNQQKYADLIHSQLQKHWWEENESGYDIVVEKSYQIFEEVSLNFDKNEKIRNVEDTIVEGDRLSIRNMIFGNFQKCIYSFQKFDSYPEIKIAEKLEQENMVLKWFKPQKKFFNFQYKSENGFNLYYEPDFVFETEENKIIAEIKREDEINSFETKSKASSAIKWCQLASEYEKNLKNKKKWIYLLIPDTKINLNTSITGLINSYNLSV